MTGVRTLAQTAVLIPAVWAGLLWCIPRRWVMRAAMVGALACAASSLSTAASGLARLGDPVVDDWLALDAAGGLLVGVIGAVGLISVLVSPAYLASSTDAIVSRRRRDVAYFSILFAFWAVLVAVPLAGNLGLAWLFIEATTAASALLVGFSGKGRALEAGWKYLILTTLGLGVALLGIALLAAGIPGGSLGSLSWRALPQFSLGAQSGLVAYLLLLAGLAAKVGWAPVHNWLPDAHSEAPAPVSAMLSSALLPAVLLVAWRCEQGLAPAIGQAQARGGIIAFGLVSLAVAVPFLARSLPWKRMLAYSSLEHMGVIAVGVGFASPLALTGVAIHVVAHALAKTLGFCATTPLLSYEPAAASDAVSGVARSQPGLGAVMAVSLGTLSGLPPLPLFVSELLIIAGGFQAGMPWLASAVAVLLALAFLGLLHSLLETTVGDAGRRARAPLVGMAGVGVLASVSTLLLLGMAAASVWLLDTGLASALARGVQ